MIFRPLVTLFAALGLAAAAAADPLVGGAAPSDPGGAEPTVRSASIGPDPAAQVRELGQAFFGGVPLVLVGGVVAGAVVVGVAVSAVGDQNNSTSTTN